MIRNKQRDRFGATLLEMVAAAAMLAVFLATSMQMQSAISSSERTLEVQALAQQAVDNLAEMLLALPDEQREELFTEVLETDGKALAVQMLPEDIVGRLPEVELLIGVFPVEDLSGERVSLVLSWKGNNRQNARPVKLTFWVFAKEQS